MKKHTTKIILLAVIALIATSCKIDVSGIRGKGDVKQKTFTINEEFNKLYAKEGWEIELIPSSENKMVVNANENLISQLQYDVEGGQLTIESKKSINSGTREIKLYFTSEINSIKTSSGADVSSDNVFEQEKITLEASSGSEINLNLKTKNTMADCSSGAEISLEGTSIYFEGEASSGSEINAKKLKTKECIVEASSGASIEIYNEDTINADVSSGGNIDYYGSPQKIKQKKSISGGNIDFKGN